MSHTMGRLIACLTLTAALLVNPPAGFPASPGTSEEDPLAECAKKMEKMFSRVIIQAQELALDHLKILHKQQMAIVPLKEPRGGIKAIQWSDKDLATTFELIRLLRAGKIGAVGVWPFLHAPGELYITRGVPLDVIKNCQKEQLQDAFGKCTECDVFEWLNIKP